MASSSIEIEKNEEIDVQLSLEEKASLDEIIKQAEVSLESDEVLNQSLTVIAESESLDEGDEAAKPQIVVVAGALKNQTNGPLSVMAKKIYAGYIVKDFPSPLGSAGVFAMGAMLNKCVEAAVVYVGKNKAKAECGWLLGFVACKDTCKVYVDCGPKAKFIKIDWVDIKKKIEQGGMIARHEDKETKTSVYATIVCKNGKCAVAAAFLG